MDDRFPFSVAFGPADTRENCIASSQKVYERLLLRSSSEVLHFNSIAEIAIDKDGNVHKEKLKQLVRLFRPSRDGELGKIEFIKSIDAVYKDFRVLQAAIENSGSVDRAFELMINIVFFSILWCIMLYIVGIDPLALFVSFSSFVVGFSFMVGNASSRYFEGLLFILARREWPLHVIIPAFLLFMAHQFSLASIGPYDIGDRISVSDPENDTSPNGSTTWFVEDLGVYSTVSRVALVGVYGSAFVLTTLLNTVIDCKAGCNERGCDVLERISC